MMLNLPCAEMGVYLSLPRLRLFIITKTHVASDLFRARWECVIEKKKENLGIFFRALYNKCLIKSKPLNFQFLSLKVQNF